MLSEDGLFSVLKDLIYILEIQRFHIDQIDSEMLLVAMKNVESDPFAIVRHADPDETTAVSYMKHLNKETLREVKYNPEVYKELQTFYDSVVSKINNFWN